MSELLELGFKWQQINLELVINNLLNYGKHFLTMSLVKSLLYMLVLSPFKYSISLSK